jgi:replicative DNA helicase Mcm
MDDKIIQNIRPTTTEYLKVSNLKDIQNHENAVAVDLGEWYQSDPIGAVPFLEFLEEYPKEGIELLEECYSDAYYSLNGEKISAVAAVYNIPNKFNQTKAGKLNEIEDIKVKTYGKMMEVEGIIVLATKIKMAMKRACFVCTQCGEKKVVNIDNPHEAFFEPVCPKCAQNMLLLEDDPDTHYTDFQEIKIQEPLDKMSDPEAPPKYVSIFLENSPGFYTGRVKVTGTITKTQKNKRIMLYDLVFKGSHCKDVEEKLESDFTEEEAEIFKKASKIPNIIEIMSDLLFYEIKGHEQVKKAIFLQQIKGVKKGNKRADSHILLITDPGTGKSVMLRKLVLIEGNVYGSANMASGVGLTAGVVQERTEIGDSTYVVKPGLLVRANKGTACIDEFATMKNHDPILEAMESQTIHLNKGGINAKLPAECAILAAANPKWGRYDPNVSVYEQINLASPIISRFDLIFPIKDEPNPVKDKAIAEHIINIHRSYLGTTKNESIVLASKEIDGITIDFKFIKKYIAYARTKTPIITVEAEKILKDYYLHMRKGTAQITARQLEAAIRIAEEFAKAKLKDSVDKEEAQEAIDLMNESLNQVAYDPETGKYDVNKITGPSNSERKHMQIVENAIKNLQKKSEDGTALLVDIVEKTGLSEEQVNRAIDKLSYNGDINEPKTGKFRVM